MLSLNQRNLAVCFTLLLSLAAALPAAAKLTANCEKNRWGEYELFCGETYVNTHSNVTDCFKAGKDLCAPACEATIASCQKNRWGDYELFCGRTSVSFHSDARSCIKAGKDLCP